MKMKRFLLLVLISGAALPVSGQSVTFDADAYFKSGVPWYDVKGFGASGSAQTTTGNIAIGSTSLTLGAAQDFKNGQGIAVAGAGPVPTILTPTGLTVTPQGTTGSTTYSYCVAAIDNKGGITAPTAPVSIANGNATLGNTNYNQLTWTAVTGAVMYVVYGRTGTLATLAIARVQTDGSTTVRWNDYGSPAIIPPWFVSTALPAVATPQILTATISSGAGTTNLTLSVAAATGVTGAMVRHDETAAIQAAINAATVAGGTVYLPPLPANGQYFFGNLDLSQLGGSGNQGWVVLLAGGPLAPYMPMVLNRGLHALAGLQQGTNNPSFHVKPFTMIKNTGINPFIRVTGVAANPVRIENIGIDTPYGDGVVIDTGAAQVFLDGVAVQSWSNATGSPLKVDMRASNGGAGGGFGYFIKNSLFGGPNITAQPSMIFLGGVGQVYLNTVFTVARGITFGGISTNTGACTGSFRSILSESLLDAAYITISGNQQCFALLLDNVHTADNVVVPSSLFNITDSATLNMPTVTGLDGPNQLIANGSQPVSSMNVPDTGYVSSLRLGGRVPDRLFYADKNRQQSHGQVYQAPSSTLSVFSMLMGPPAPSTPTLQAGGTLTLGQTYYYVVTALDAAGNETGRSVEVSATPTVSGTQSIQVSWLVPVTGAATSYRVYRSQTSGSGGAGPNGGYFAAAGSPFTDSGAAPAPGVAPTEFTGFASLLRFDGTASGGTNWWINPPAAQNMGFGTQTPGMKWDFNGAMRTNAQFTSTLATGTAPLAVTSTTPVANLTTVPNCGNAAGAQQTGCKIVFGTATLTAGTVTVNFTAPYTFTSGTSYVCTASDQSATAAVGIGAQAATSVVFNGTGIDVIAYTCVGN